MQIIVDKYTYKFVPYPPPPFVLDFRFPFFPTLIFHHSLTFIKFMTNKEILSQFRKFIPYERQRDGNVVSHISHSDNPDLDSFRRALSLKYKFLR